MKENMIMRKRIILSLFVVATVVFGLVCGSPALAAKKVTLRVMTPESDFTEAWINLWNEQNPNIQVVREDLNPAKWIADYMAGTSADLMNIQAGAEIPFFFKRGMLLDLTDYF